MAKWSSTETSWTTAATADTTNLADTTHHTLTGGVAGDRRIVSDVIITGAASASAPNIMLAARTSLIGVTLSVGRTAALDPATLALTNPPVTYNTATTKPQRSATLSLLSIAINAFGGAFRWAAVPGYELGFLGVAVNTGELNLSAFTGSTAGLVQSSFLFEPL